MPRSLGRMNGWDGIRWHFPLASELLSAAALLDSLAGFISWGAMWWSGVDYRCVVSARDRWNAVEPVSGGLSGRLVFRGLVSCLILDYGPYVCWSDYVVFVDAGDHSPGSIYRWVSTETDTMLAGLYICDVAFCIPLPKALLRWTDKRNENDIHHATLLL